MTPPATPPAAQPSELSYLLAVKIDQMICAGYYEKEIAHKIDAHVAREIEKAAKDWPRMSSLWREQEAKIIALTKERDNLDLAWQEMERRNNEMQSKISRLRDACNWDASLNIKKGNLQAIAWHLEQGSDNGGINRTALANQLRSISQTLMRISEALALTDGDFKKEAT